MFCVNVLPALTDNGICYSFNAKHPNKMMKKTKYTEAFSKVFGNDDEKLKPYTISGKTIDQDFVPNTLQFKTLPCSLCTYNKLYNF